MNIDKPLWIGSQIDIRHNEDAEEALKTLSDAKYWNDNDGIVKIDEDRWKRAQSFEKDCWMLHGLYATSDRHDEHSIGFDNYKILDQNLGDVIEIGCGPFTQLRTIITDRIANSITLLDPLINEYLKHPHCTYRSSGYTLIPEKAEKLDTSIKYDTVICINVLEHVQDALLVLSNIYDCLKPNGTLIFHDRNWDSIDINKLYDVGHPIRLKQSIITNFINKFTILHQSDNNYYIATK